MGKLSKKTKAILEKYDLQKSYALNEAAAVLKDITSTKFDSSVDRGTPFEFTLGEGRVIKGWDEGLAMMQKGEKGLLVIPSDLGYGSRGTGIITPFSTLVFEVELIDFKNAE